MAKYTCSERTPAPNPPYPPGLAILVDFVSTTEESELLSFFDRQKWRTDLARRTIHYGGTYCLMPPRSATPDERKRIEADIKTADALPGTLHWLVDRMVEQGLYQENARPEFCIVNEYRDAQGISAHVESFRFGEPVCALTLGCGDYVRFHELINRNDGSVRTGKAAEATKTGRKLDVWLPSRSVMVMKGKAREKWQHEIVRSRKGRFGDNWRRVSLTFRVEKVK